MGKFCDTVEGLKPTIMMVSVQIAFTGVNIFYKLAANNGMNLQVVIAYRFLFAVATVIPLALIFERKNRPRLTWTIVFQGFICALFGATVAQNLYAESLALTSATYAAATTNLQPALTFLLAIFFRMEKAGLNTMAGKAKAKMSEIYPCHYSSAALISIMGSFQAIVYALCMERDWNQWKLAWNLRLLTVAYMGILGSGIVWAFMMSCVRMRGPLFVSVFNPLMLVLVALSSSLLLDENFYLGRYVRIVLGAVIIIGGLYSVLWGKSKEMKKISRLVPSDNFDPKNDQVDSVRGTSFKGFNHGDSNIMAVAPSLIIPVGNEIIELFDEDHEQDLEAKISSPRQ
ncbi:hypothetical protein RD792_001957 [Penstemon davidsonii]|uniref:WAT1-related protein n=1 Tax=Penstemon davidsonii TaxID=160366 RepID=A0ABR0DPP9_9LAMI|nr:hypothetical protein RD792_001957 [Penstemon davidsonii]